MSLSSPYICSENADPLVLAQKYLASYLKHYPGIFFIQKKDLSVRFIHPQQESFLKPNEDGFFDFLYAIHEEDKEMFLNKLKQAQPNEKISMSYRLTCLQTKALVYVLDIRSSIFDSDGRFSHYEGIWVDQTRQMIAERHLAQASWLEHLAIVTSGLVHDFSNVITGIYSLSELYHSSIDQDSPMYGGFYQIKKNAFEAQKLIRRIIDLNRISKGACFYYNLESLIKEQLDLFDIIFSKRIQIDTDFIEQETPVYLDALGFRQMFLNFAINAKDAIPKKGKVIIKTCLVEKGEEIFSQAYGGPFLSPARGVEVSFSDTGVGIDSIHYHKLFMPFFSTKDVYKGSGFGLYNAKLFMDKHNGLISFKSKAGEGTTFYLFFPLVDCMTDNGVEDMSSPLLKDNKRYRGVVYSSVDSSNFELTSYLRENEWELVYFSDHESLKKYLVQTIIHIDAFFVIDVGADSSIYPILEYFKLYYSNIKIVVQVLGCNPDAKNIFLKKNEYLLLDESHEIKDGYASIINFLNTNI